MLTVPQVLDFGAARDGIPERDRSRRIVVDEYGQRTELEDDTITAI